MSKPNLFFLISTILINLSLLNLFAYKQSQLSPYLKIDYLDVGQGDGALISFPYGPQLIIDAGPDKNFLRSLSRNLNFFDRTIDYLLITHAHDDHFVGAVELIRRYKVGSIILSNYDSKDLGYNYLIKEANRNNVSITKIDYETQQKINGVNILYIPPTLGEKNTNNQSLLVKINYGLTSFLFMGDLEADGEKRLLEKNLNFSAQVIKAGHHGSKTSSSKKLLFAVNPQLAVISVGENKFGHPSEITINRLKKLGISIYRTDQKSDIHLISDGKTIKNKGKN